MKKILAFLLAALPIWCIAQTLKFTPEGEFKIMQITDTHYIHGNQHAEVALRKLSALIDAEKPDLIVHTGDIIFSQPAEESLRDIMQVFNEKGIPFIALLGNHDEENGLSRTQLYDIIRSYSNNIQPSRKETEIFPDCVLPIFTHDGKMTSALLYCLDSGDYSKSKNIKGYDWIHANQIEWYRNTSTLYTDANGGTPLPALAFFHIPVPEFSDAARHEGSILIGSRMEAACPPNVNSGFFTAAKEKGDIMGIFCGHDHDNDYAALWQDIVLGYGRYSGGNTVYNNLPSGVRIIILKESERSFKSYIHQKDGVKLNYINYPESFTKSDYSKRPLEE